MKHLFSLAILIIGFSVYAENGLNRQIECTAQDNNLETPLTVKLNYTITNPEGFRASLAQVTIGDETLDGLNGISEFYPFAQRLDSPREPNMYALNMGAKGIMLLRIPWGDLGEKREGYISIKGNQEYILSCNGIDVIK